MAYRLLKGPLAAPELQAILPPEMTRQIRSDTLAWIPGTYVDHRLRHRYTDLLYKARSSW